MSIRGQLPEPLFKTFMFSLNPWSDKHWIKRRFFDNPDENTLAMTTTYLMNEFLSPDDIAMFETMKKVNPRRYAIEGEANWGVAEGLIYTNWRTEDFDIDELVTRLGEKKNARGLPRLVQCCGMDFGFTDETAFTASYVDTVEYKIYVYYEFFKSNVLNKQIAATLITDGFGECRIYGDSADARSIRELNVLGLGGLIPVKKSGANFVVDGIRKIQDFEIIVSPKCPNVADALGNYAWSKDKLDESKLLPVPEHEWSHLCDCIRYSCQDIGFRFGLQV